MRLSIALVLGTAALALGGCGGGGSGGGGGGCTPGTVASVTIRSSGVTPTAVCVRTTGTVTFTNQDTVAHTLATTDPACPELNGVLVGAAPNPNTANVVFTNSAAKVCNYAAAPTGAAFQGTVAVNDGFVEGPGY